MRVRTTIRLIAFVSIFVVMFILLNVVLKGQVSNSERLEFDMALLWVAWLWAYYLVTFSWLLVFVLVSFYIFGGKENLTIDLIFEAVGFTLLITEMMLLIREFREDESSVVHFGHNFILFFGAVFTISTLGLFMAYLFGVVHL